MSDALIDVFAGVLQVDATQLDDRMPLAAMEKWDSLAAMHLVAAIEEKFKVHLSTKEIMNVTAIGIIRKTLQEKNVRI
ncbi:MAG: acyl carrier protein [Micavibrio sp.]|nr:acyl carrier protein [Micavibrio sp.]